MQLTFESLNELNEMIAELGYVHCMDLARIRQIAAQHAPAYLAEGAAIEVKADTASDLPNVQELDAGPATEAAEAAGPATEAAEAAGPAKRKRRTKAEMEAARAEPETIAPAANPLDNLKSEVSAFEVADTDDMKAAITEMAGLYDGSDALAQLDEGRKFIASHGFPAYNETMHVVGVPSNIAAHTPEQRSLHRAAMAYMAARKG